jgi:hypothetical protein
MKRLTIFFTILLVIYIFALPTLAQNKAADGFDKLKSLVGEWQGENKDGKNVTVIYELVSNESALLERLQSEDEPNMVTMYHLDGDYLMMTHYCAAKNQPRMRAEFGKDGDNVLRFAFIDATNLAKPTDGHMHKLAIKFVDNDHVNHEWTWRQNEQEKVVGFELERKK